MVQGHHKHLLDVYRVPACSEAVDVVRVVGLDGIEERLRFG
jgi:hypothetical protein